MLFSPVVLRTKFFVFNLILINALMLVFQFDSSAAESVTLAWNSGLDPNIAGYKIYYGTESHNYSGVVTAGNTNTVTISGLVAGTTYYFAATSYDAIGLESGLSNEASYTVPIPPPSLTSVVRSGNQFSFTVAGASGSLYVVQTSANLVDWVSLQTNSAPFVFADTNTAGFSRRFYRAFTLQP